MRIYLRKKARYSMGRVLLLSTIIWILAIALYPLVGQAFIKPHSGASIYGGVRGLSEDKDISKSNNLSAIDIYGTSKLDLLSDLKGYNLLYFEQRDCPGCKELSPAIDRYFSLNSSTSIRLIRIHIDEIFNENQDAALKLISSYRVPGTPTLILVKDGVEIARHIGVFRGDQYEGLKSFIESATTGKSSSSGDTVIRPLSSLGLGLLAALSPCSLPMIVMFASSARLGGGFSRAIKVFTSLIAILIPASLGISIASNAGRIFGVSVYYALVTYVAAVSLTWGLLTFSNREPLLSVGGKSALIFPILGMQCSFPFLLAVISMLPKEPIAALTSSLAFSIGYIVPYIGSNIFLNTLGSIAQGRWGKLTRYLQGAILTSAGVYVLATAIPYIIE